MCHGCCCVSRPVRWDSDHVVLLDDETQAIASEIVRHNLFDRVYRSGFLRRLYQPCRRVGYRYPQHEKALLRALLEPTDQLRQLEASGDYTARLALLEEQNLCRGRPSGKCIASVTTRRLAASGWTAFASMKKRS